MSYSVEEATGKSWTQYVQASFNTRSQLHAVYVILIHVAVCGSKFSVLFFFFFLCLRMMQNLWGVQLPPSVHADCTWTYNWYAFILPLLSLLPFPSSPLTTISSKIPREAVSSALLRQWARLTESMIWRLTTYPRLEHSEKQWQEEIISWS